MADCCNTGTFINVDDWDTIDYANELEFNTKLWFDHNMLQIGAWENVVTGADNCDQNLYTLSPVTEPNINVTKNNWATPKKGLVWETVTYGAKSTIPMAIYHNGGLVTGFDIDYNNGIITHTTNYAGTLTATYSYRSVNSYISSTARWWWEILSNTYDLDDEGEIWGVLRKNGVILPCVIIKAGPLLKTMPVQLGSNMQYVDRPVDFYILAGSDFTKNKIAHILTSQINNVFTFFNSNTADFPIQCGNRLVNSNTYPDLVGDAQWKCVQIVAVSETHIESPCAGLALARARLTFQMGNPVKGTTTPAP